MMKRKGALCLLVLLLLLAGYLFTSSSNRLSSPATGAFHSRSAHTFLSVQALMPLPMMVENVPHQLEASPLTQSHPVFSPNDLSFGVGRSPSLFSISQNALLAANALLLLVIARTLGLSFLMLRE